MFSPGKVLATEHFLKLIYLFILDIILVILDLCVSTRFEPILCNKWSMLVVPQLTRVVTRWLIILITCHRSFSYYRFLLRLLTSSDLRADFTNYMDHLFVYFRCLIFGIDLLLRLFRLIIDHNQSFPSCSVSAASVWTSSQHLTQFPSTVTFSVFSQTKG